ncbi:MerR family transcriptional regulator [Urechidicola sp. KH5]
MHIDLPEKRYYKIGEVAKAFGVNNSLIRFWEKEFDVLKPKKNNKGNRLFTAQDVQNLKVIYDLVKEKGYTLEGAKKKMKNQNKKSLSNQEIVAQLEHIKQELITIKNQLGD